VHALTAAPLFLLPAETDDRNRFSGYDAVVVTWTAAKAAGPAAMPAVALVRDRHNVQAYIPLVAGRQAPFNDYRTDMSRETTG
jgi:hypothetical protein